MISDRRFDSNIILSGESEITKQGITDEGEIYAVNEFSGILQAEGNHSAALFRRNFCRNVVKKTELPAGLCA